VDGKLSPMAERGKEIYATAGCANCHSGPNYTNLKKYDLGLGTGMDQDKLFDTPTLIEVWRTAPYLHDGRAATIKDALSTGNDPLKKHGKITTLKPDEIDALVTYVLSL
jgi:cytochrome c peroxidase